MKLLKWLLIVVGAAVLLFAAALAFIAATFDPNQYKAQVAELVREKTHRTLTIEGDIRLMLFPKLGVYLGKTRLSDFQSEQTFASLDDMRVSLALLPLLSRQVVVDQIQLDGLHVNLVKRKDGKTNFDDLLGEAKKETPQRPTETGTEQAPIKLDVDGIRVSKAVLVWRDEVSGGDYAVSDLGLKIGRLAPGIPARFDLAATIRANQPKLDVKLQARGTLMADLEQQVFSGNGLTVSLNGDVAGIRALAADLSGNCIANLQKQTVSADLVLKADESRIKATLAITDFAALRSTIDIAIDRLNVDKYLPSGKSGESAKTGKTAARPQPERSIDFSPLRKLDVAGSVRIDDLIAYNLKMQNVRVDVKVKSGRLDVDSVDANLYQGTLKGSASIDADSGRITTRQKLSGISIGPLITDGIGQDLLDGRGDVVLDLSTSGNLVSAMKRSLNGTARIELKNGAIKGINLAQSLRDANALLAGGKPASDQGAAAGEKTDFAELTASFNIRNGIAHNGDMQAKSPYVRLSGQGDINLPDSTLNYLVKAAIVASGEGQGGKEAADLGGVTIPVRVYGPFTAVRYKLELSSALSDSLKQKIQGNKQVIKEKLQDKLRDKLKQLF